MLILHQNRSLAESVRSSIWRGLKAVCLALEAFVSRLSNRPFAACHSRGTNCHAETQKLHWDKTNEGNCHLKLCMPFVGLAPVQLLRPSMAVLYHLNGKLQRAYSKVFWYSDHHNVESILQNGSGKCYLLELALVVFQICLQH